MIKAAIFDFAGVIADEGYWQWVAENFELSEEKRKRFNEMSDKADKGEISEEQFLKTLGKASGKNASRVKTEIFEKIKLRPSVIQTIRRIRKSCKTALLSNYISEWMSGLRKANNLDKLFDAVVVSSEVGMIKPEPEIYIETAKRLGVKPEECVMVDDRQVNVDAAAQLGMKPLLFTSQKETEAALSAYGIIT